MDKRGKRTGKVESSAGGKVETLWLTRTEICSRLGIGKTTLYKRIKDGDIQKNRVGKTTLYRWKSGNLAEFPRGKVETLTAEKGGNLAEFPPAPEKGGNSETILELTEVVAHPEVDVAPLTALIDDLVDRVAQLEREKANALSLVRDTCRERDEAISVGHQIADDRDRALDLMASAHTALARSNDDVRRLHSAIDVLTDAIAAVSASPLAVPVRRRLHAALATC